MSYPYIIQGSNLVVVINNKPFTIAKTHITYQKVIDAIKAQDWETVRLSVDPKKVVISFGSGNVDIKDDTFYWKGEEMHNTLSSRMVSMLQEGFTIEPMVAFMENLMLNPSKRSVTELYGFLEKNNLPITPDGHFLAYKKVRENYFDCHSGTMDNSPGNVVEMERNAVDDDKDRTCSTGLHFCSIDYLKSFGGARTVIVKINPRDIVSIPSDYNNSKGRTCRYEVVGELGVNPEDAFTTSVQSNAVGSVTVVKEVSVVTKMPKIGTGAYSKGYETGYTNKIYSYDDAWKNQSYVKGYDDGSCDRKIGHPQKYQHSSTVTTTKTRKALSMTKSAITKRAARAALKARRG